MDETRNRVGAINCRCSIRNNLDPFDRSDGDRTHVHNRRGTGISEAVAVEQRQGGVRTDAAQIEGRGAIDVSVLIGSALTVSDARILSASEALRQAARDLAERSEARRGGKECVSPCSSRWSPEH